MHHEYAPITSSVNDVSTESRMSDQNLYELIKRCVENTKRMWNDVIYLWWSTNVIYVHKMFEDAIYVHKMFEDATFSNKKNWNLNML